jgi:hypothetical protein|uniref:Uncharacterized protein n=1 Tax=Phage sp. ctHEp8 TaxID=2825790 RepID=A0A8S5TY57_9VIRU|nr:MAG TPA: hypothetical protein [Phage sp. ctHEp8]DAK49785.1 MAG TPA: hypothetical protein [Caudoviricetes sp.]DAQ17157.1 MAG TPA: hypothetical protein [Caudoviricetes sp.]DAS54036.1 MAG TPA: hypothetical protein [Caudoviricetes sp.]DAS70312.1 MAG TPA: hypothetical protein [Bacteriophage sp.]
MKCEKFKVRLKTKQTKIKVELSKKEQTCDDLILPNLLLIYNLAKA